MEIIKQGINPEEIKQEKTCLKCKTVFSFVNKDIQPDFRDGSYVACPVCNFFISAKKVVINPSVLDTETLLSNTKSYEEAEKRKELRLAFSKIAEAGCTFLVPSDKVEDIIKFTNSLISKKQK